MEKHSYVRESMPIRCEQTQSPIMLKLNILCVHIEINSIE